MNGEVIIFIRKIGPQPEKKILEVGSMDVNGSPRESFKTAGEYIGIDFRPGRGVDVVMNAEDIHTKWPAGYFDVILCCETLEHCEHWRDVLTSFWTVLKIGGKCVVTTPTRKKGRHNYPNDYWRFELDEYRKIFAKQTILKCEEVGSAGVGVIVEKVCDELDLDIDPYRIPPPK